LPTPTLAQAEAVLHRYWGFAAFRPGQETAIEAVLQGRDMLVIMPTGGGKSLCYQVPAMLFEGVTIVVSPLISLMKDYGRGAVTQGRNRLCTNGLRCA
jgi:ATP-dependent DNA helicase RecQ